MDERTLETVIEDTVRRLSGYISRWAQHPGVSSDVAADLTQAVRIRAWESARTYRAEKGVPLQAYINFLCRDAVRKRLFALKCQTANYPPSYSCGRRARHLPQTDLPRAVSYDSPASSDDERPLSETLADERLTDAFEALVAAERRESFYQALNELSDEDRALMLHYVNGGTGVEVAERSGVSRQAVDQRTKRALKRLKVCMFHDMSLAPKPGAVAKLSKAQVEEMRNRWKSGAHWWELATRYGVSRTTVHRVCKAL